MPTGVVQNRYRLLFYLESIPCLRGFLKEFFVGLKEPVFFIGYAFWFLGKLSSIS
jgi:hypothetical protein